MKNSQLAQEFANGATKGEGSNMFIDKRAIYSYGYHFPIALRLDDAYLFVSDGYSQTTTKHKGYVHRAIKGEIVFVSVRLLKEVIDKDIKSLKEYIVYTNYNESQ